MVNKRLDKEEKDQRNDHYGYRTHNDEHHCRDTLECSHAAFKDLIEVHCIYDVLVILVFAFIKDLIGCSLVFLAVAGFFLKIEPVPCSNVIHIYDTFCCIESEDRFAAVVICCLNITCYQI